VKWQCCHSLFFPHSPILFFPSSSSAFCFFQISFILHNNKPKILPSFIHSFNPNHISTVSNQIAAVLHHTIVNTATLVPSVSVFISNISSFSITSKIIQKKSQINSICKQIDWKIQQNFIKSGTPICCNTHLRFLNSGTPILLFLADFPNSPCCNRLSWFSFSLMKIHEDSDCKSLKKKMKIDEDSILTSGTNTGFWCRSRVEINKATNKEIKSNKFKDLKEG